jgi:hypothetical protein
MATYSVGGGIEVAGSLLLTVSNSGPTSSSYLPPAGHFVVLSNYRYFTSNNNPNNAFVIETSGNTLFRKNHPAPETSFGPIASGPLLVGPGVNISIFIINSSFATATAALFGVIFRNK